MIPSYAFTDYYIVMSLLPLSAIIFNKLADVRRKLNPNLPSSPVVMKVHQGLWFVHLAFSGVKKSLAEVNAVVDVSAAATPFPVRAGHLLASVAGTAGQVALAARSRHCVGYTGWANSRDESRLLARWKIRRWLFDNQQIIMTAFLYLFYFFIFFVLLKQGWNFCGYV